LSESNGFWCTGLDGWGGGHIGGYRGSSNSGTSLSACGGGGTFLDGNCSPLLDRNGRFSITVRVTTLAFIWYNKSI
jgi:hypothetical protein